MWEGTLPPKCHILPSPLTKDCCLGSNMLYFGFWAVLTGFQQFLTNCWPHSNSAMMSNEKYSRSFLSDWNSDPAHSAGLAPQGLRFSVFYCHSDREKWVCSNETVPQSYEWDYCWDRVCYNCNNFPNWQYLQNYRNAIRMLHSIRGWCTCPGCDCKFLCSTQSYGCIHPRIPSRVSFWPYWVS